jgi:hypothetical protein
MWEKASEWLGRKWWGLCAAYICLFAFVYALIWAIIEPLGIPDTFTTLPNMLKNRALYHVLTTLVVTPHLLLGMELWRRTSFGSLSQIRHPLRSRDARDTHRPKLFFSNSSKRTIDVIWINYQGAEEPRRPIGPHGGLHSEHTFATHPFLIKDHSTGERLLVVMPVNESDLEATIVIEDPARL